MPISPELARVYASAPTDVYYVETLSLEHPAFADGIIYITNQPGGWTATIETFEVVEFLPVPFATVPPRSADEAALTLQVGIDNASAVLMENLELISQSPTDPILVKYRIYLSNDTATVQNDPPLKLDVINVTATMDTISFAAGITNLRKLPFPAQLYDTVLYPGLQR